MVLSGYVPSPIVRREKSSWYITLTYAPILKNLWSYTHVFGSWCYLGAAKRRPSWSTKMISQD